MADSELSKRTAKKKPTPPPNKDSKWKVVQANLKGTKQNSKRDTLLSIYEICKNNQTPTTSRVTAKKSDTQNTSSRKSITNFTELLETQKCKPNASFTGIENQNENQAAPKSTKCKKKTIEKSTEHVSQCAVQKSYTPTPAAITEIPECSKRTSISKNTQTVSYNELNKSTRMEPYANEHQTPIKMCRKVISNESQDISSANNKDGNLVIEMYKLRDELNRVKRDLKKQEMYTAALARQTIGSDCSMESFYSDEEVEKVHYYCKPFNTPNTCTRSMKASESDFFSPIQSDDEFTLEKLKKQSQTKQKTRSIEKQFCKSCSSSELLLKRKKKTYSESYIESDEHQSEKYTYNTKADTAEKISINEADAEDYITCSKKQNKQQPMTNYVGSPKRENPVKATQCNLSKHVIEEKSYEYSPPKITSTPKRIVTPTSNSNQNVQNRKPISEAKQCSPTTNNTNQKVEKREQSYRSPQQNVQSTTKKECKRKMATNTKTSSEKKSRSDLCHRSAEQPTHHISETYEITETPTTSRSATLKRREKFNQQNKQNQTSKLNCNCNLSKKQTKTNLSPESVKENKKTESNTTSNNSHARWPPSSSSDILQSFSTAVSNSSAYKLKNTSSFCLFCKEKSLPIFKDNLFNELKRIIGSNDTKNIILTITVQTNGIYHINISKKPYGTYMGCAYADEKAFLAATQATEFRNFVTFFVASDQSTINEKHLGTNCTIQFVRYKQEPNKR